MDRLKINVTPVVILFLLGTTIAYVEGGSRNDYWFERSRILKSEQDLMIGSDVQLNAKEQAANEVIMKLKTKEIDDGFENPSTFLPAQNFLLASEKIEKSKVFQMIRKLAKGAVLHAHDIAIVFSDYIYSNITFRSNLYVCDIDGLLRFKFFDKPTMDQCKWKLLSSVRKADKTGAFEERIKKHMTMITANPNVAYPDVNAAWNKFVSIYRSIGPMLNYKPVFEDYFYQGLSELHEDNVQYLELRSTLTTLYDLDGNTYGPVEVAKIHKNISDRYIRDHPDFIGVKLIYAPSRKCNDSVMDKYLEIVRKLKKELPDFVVGFDLIGQEDKGETIKKFAQKLRNLGNDIQVFFHAGETNWYGTSSDQNLIDAVLLNSKRIGHGYALLKHPKVMELVRKRNIAIEVSPISNQVLNLVKDLRNHPASALFAENYPVVISNDDPGLWGAKGLSYDFYEAFVGIMSRDADLRALKKLAINSIEYSSLTEDEKKQAFRIWSRQWDRFVEEVSTMK